jgi:type I restriction enzyme S subunit
VTEVNYVGPIVESAWIQSGDVIIGMDGDFNVARWRGQRALLNQRVCCLRPRRHTDSGYIAYLLPLPLRIINDLAYSTTVKHLSSGDVRKIRLGAPPESEQRAITMFLDRETAWIDALVAKEERLVGLLEEQRSALRARAVTRGLDQSAPVSETGSIVFPEIPDGWELRKLRRVITRIRRPVKVNLDAEYREIGIRSWGKGIFHKEAVRGALLEEKSVFEIEPGDFILNIVFAWEGAVAVATELERGMVGSHRFPTFRCSDEVSLDYLLMVLQTEQGRALMEVNSPGAAGRNKTIRLDQFLSETIPLPSLDEQREIIRKYRSDEDRLLALVGRLHLAVRCLKEFRTALISAAVTGKIDVREEVA